MTVRAKFIVDEVRRVRHGYNEVKLSAVVGTEGDNADWSEATPTGSIEMTITNKAALDQFEPGSEYFVNFELDDKS